MEGLTVLLWLLATAMVVAGLAGIVFPLLPGLPLMFAGFWVAAWADGYQHVGMASLVILGLLTAIGILCDFLASALGAKRVGASPRAVTGALLGSIIGIFFGLPGLIVGPFLGAVIGEVATRRGLGRAAEVGVATWVGLLVGTLAKVALSIAMIGVFVFAWFV
ncbi:MAG: DUF456 domain-containing protein [Gammaproteobacteria bacterium]